MVERSGDGGVKRLCGQSAPVQRRKTGDKVTNYLLGVIQFGDAFRSPVAGRRSPRRTRRYGASERNRD